MSSLSHKYQWNISVMIWYWNMGVEIQCSVTSPSPLSGLIQSSYTYVHQNLLVQHRTSDRIQHQGKSELLPSRGSGDIAFHNLNRKHQQAVVTVITLSVLSYECRRTKKGLLWKEEFAPKRSKFFPFRVPFQKGVNILEVISPECIHFSLSICHLTEVNKQTFVII